MSCNSLVSTSFQKKKKKFSKLFYYLIVYVHFQNFADMNFRIWPILKNFTDIIFRGKGWKTSKPRKFLSAKASSLKVYSQNEVTNKQSNRFRVVFISLLIANCHSNLSSIKNVIHIWIEFTRMLTHTDSTMLKD